MDKATPTPSPASVDSVIALKKLLSDIAAMLSPTADSYASDDPSGAIETAYSVAVEAIDICAEAERLAAQSAPTEIHADTPRHELLPRLRRLASDFQSHPLSRSISECEEAGIAMAEAAKQIEMLCRTRDTVVNHSGRMRKEIAALTEHRDFLLREIAKIDGDPGNACHYAIEAISAVCADLAEPVPPLPEPEPTYLYSASTVAAITAQRDAALARVAELEKDAARYRWLRNRIDPREISECFGFRGHNVDEKISLRTDSSIDAALTKGQLAPQPQQEQSN